MEALYAYGGDAILSGSLLALCLRQPLSKHTCNHAGYVLHGLHVLHGLYLLDNHQPHGYLLSAVNDPICQLVHAYLF